MSSTQKQSAAGGPQTQRYSTSPYQPILPQTPNSFAGAETYQVSTPAGSYVPQGQGPNQGPAMRSMAPTGPPNQASTPPNTDLKVQNLQGQITQMQFVQNPVRTVQAPYYQPRAAGPPSQTPRMPNQQHRPQTPQLYPSQYVVPSAMYIQPNPVFYSGGQRPPSGLIPTQAYAPGVFGQQIYQTYSQQTTSGVPAYTPVPAYYPPQPPTIMSRTSGGTVTAAPNNAPGSIPAASLISQPPPSHQNYQKNSGKRRPNALKIIDPTTGEDRLPEILHENNSNPPSGESSARQTPQPAASSKEVQATFAKQVIQKINEDRHHNEQPPPLHEPMSGHFSPPPMQSAAPAHYDIQHSTLHYNAKEFVSNVKSNKESTPVVSANSDAVEVTPKIEPGSPVKAKKATRDTKPETKECDKTSSIVKEEPVPQSNIISTPDSFEDTPPVVVDIPKENIEKIVVKKDADTKEIDTKPTETIETKIQAPLVEATSGKSKSNKSSKQTNHNGKNYQPPQSQTLPNSQGNDSATTKTTHKSKRGKDLNMKGANKEGTDMDAFNDNTKEINSNTLLDKDTEIIDSKDVVNANVPDTTTEIVVPPTVEDENVINSNQNSDNSNVDNNENVTSSKPEVIVNTAAPTVTKAPKPFDVTNLNWDTPKSILPPFQNSIDETDRAIQTEKQATVNNDVTAKASADNPTNDVKPTLPYKPGQWAPDHPDGKKQYERDFLLALRNHPNSKHKPDNILDVVAQDERNRQIDGRLSMGGRTDFTNPPFANYGGKSNSQRVLPTKRNSQSGKSGNRDRDRERERERERERDRDKGSNKPGPKVSISLREDVKLHQTENAWKPNRLLVEEDPTPDDEKKTDMLYRKVRAVLNKLTPQKFDTLVNQVRKLNIDSKERLEGVINLVFDKAIDEPNFSLAYAMMCKELQIMQVPVGGNADDRKSVVFRTLLVTRCQNEFEKQSVDETERSGKLKEIEECEDPEKKKELMFELEEYDRRLRLKSVGCIRFIGELFKQQMLTANIMRRCLQTLLNNKDEESLECLCKLLTTVGKELESKNIDLSSIFDEMKKIVEGKRQKVSSRIRFMLQDVTELRDSKWVPRRGDTNPKTIDQIQREAETEQFNIQVQNMNAPRKDDRNMNSRGGNQRQKVNDEGWVSTRNTRTPFSIQPDKMRAAKIPGLDEPLGSRLLFGSFSKGAGGSKVAQPTLSSNNMYAPLENMDSDRRPMNSRGSKDPYSSKGASLERNTYKSSYDGRGSRSGSQHRDNSTPMRSNGPSSSKDPPKLPPPKAQPTAAPVPTSTVPKLSEEQLQRKIQNSAEEFLGGVCSTDEFYEDLSPYISGDEWSKVVYECCNYTLEKSQTARLKTGELFAKLITKKCLTLDSFLNGFEELLSIWEDLVIDIPQIYQYFAEDLVPLFLEEVLPIDKFHKLISSLIEGSVAHKLLKPLFSLIIKEKGPNFLKNLWQNSEMKLTDFMSESVEQSFIKENNFEFLVGGESPVGIQSVLSYDDIHKKLLEFFRNKTEFDDIVNWISANVGDRVTEKKFIRTLATSIFQDSVTKNKLVPEVLSSHCRLIQKYIDNNIDYELECLYALQSLVHKLEHPQGLLLAFCDKLYEDNTFCQESFIAWEGSDDPAEKEGKGVALKQLTSFFTQLKENLEDDDYSSNSEDA